MSLWSAARCLPLLLVLAVLSCEAENHNNVSCSPQDCASSCVSNGFPGGACEDGVCTCDTSETDPFEWDGGGDTDTDTEAAANSGASLG